MNLKDRIQKVNNEMKEESYQQYSQYIEDGKPILVEQNKFEQLPSKSKFILDCIALFLLISFGRWLVVDVLTDFLLGCIFQFTTMNVFWIDRIISLSVQCLYFAYVLAIVWPVLKRRYQQLKNQETQVGLIQDVCSNWNKNDFFSASLNDPHPWKTIAKKMLLYLIGIPCVCIFFIASIGIVIFVSFCIIYQIFSLGLLLTGIGFFFLSILSLLLIARYWPKGCENHA